MTLEPRTNSNFEVRRKIINGCLDRAGDLPIDEALRDEIATTPCEGDRDKLFHDILNELEGSGPVKELFEIDDVTEIIVDADREIVFEKDSKLHLHLQKFTGMRTFQRFLGRILLEMDKTADRQNPLADGILKDGTRVHVALPPVAERPVITFRRHGKKQKTLQDLIDSGGIREETATRMKTELLNGANILICGSTGSGKTTLLRALLSEIPENERIITIEDTPEVRLEGPNRVSLVTRTGAMEWASDISLSILLRNSLRMRPDRIVVGEVRGEEALVFLDAVTTGHRGSMTSIHGGSALQALRRLEALASRAAPQWGLTAIRQAVKDSIDIIVCMAREKQSRRVHSVSDLVGVEDFGYLLNPWE